MLYLSKSKYLLGLQCPKLLWTAYNRKTELPPPEQMAEFVMAEGRKVGAVAQRLYPGGLKIEREQDPVKMHAKSLAAAASRQPLFEAGFIFGQTYALADILVPVEEDKWDLIEVKSATQIKPEYQEDIAFQKYVYQGAGLKIRRCYIMFLNRDYVRQGELEPGKLFRKENLDDRLVDILPAIPGRVERLLRLIAAKEEPEIKVGRQCSSPRDCLLEERCWEFLPEKDHVFHLSRGNQLAHRLLEQGILHLKDIPPETELNEKQQIQVRSHATGEPYIERAEIGKFLNKLSYPLYFLDFETIAPALPLYDGTRPYEDIPFQFSLHVVAKAGAAPRHHAFLADGPVDPRPEVLKQLRALLGSSGSIVAYNADFEKKCLRKSSEANAEYREWFEEIEGRFVDLLAPFSKFHYYHPKQKGSASMKAVLPALTSNNYNELEIGAGGLARSEFMRINYADQPPAAAEKERVRSALLKYCALDTQGMISILDILRHSV